MWNSRSLQYVTFSVAPSKEDSATLYSEIKTLARGLGAAQNDSVFAQAEFRRTCAALPDGGRNAGAASRSHPNVLTRWYYGPFREGNTYFIYKYGGTKRDTSFTARASHILIRARLKLTRLKPMPADVPKES